MVVATYFLTTLEVYGASPNGKRLERIKAAGNFKNNEFQNQSFTPQLSEGYSLPKVMLHFLLATKNTMLKPLSPIPTVNTNLKSLPRDENIYIWLGHSSYYLQIDGVSFLIDPVLSNYGSPFKFFNKAFEGSHLYKPEDMPDIDYLIITHDHYDHLDFPTVREIKNKVKKVVLPLGVGAHFEKWGYQSDQLLEENWGTTLTLSNQIKITFTPARHFSGRKWNRNNTLWTSYVLESQSQKIFLGGDSGYDTHFKKIGEQYGPFDFAILENGQYNEAWKYIHAMPENMVSICQDLKAKNIIPVHFGKFALAHHAWNEPLQNITDFGKLYHLAILTPKIGEVMYLDNTPQFFEYWWNN